MNAFRPEWKALARRDNAANGAECALILCVFVVGWAVMNIIMTNQL